MKFHLETINLESQILKTIIGLKHLVKNGILPVKTITDTFNQSKSKESQLTYPRIGRILSTMGFRKTKTSNGSSAIIWDDQYLSKNTFSNTQNSCSETFPKLRWDIVPYGIQTDYPDAIKLVRRPVRMKKK